MEPVGLAHVALPVSDLEQTRGFYSGVLGLAEAPDRPDFGVPGAWFVLGSDQVHVMALGPVSPDRRQHFAIEVTDAEAVAAELEAKGVEVHRSAYFPGAGRQVFIADPDGHQIELNQPERPPLR